MFAEGGDFQEEICATGDKGKIEARVPGPARFWPADKGPQPLADLRVSPRRPMGHRREEFSLDGEIADAGDHNGATYFQHQRFNAVVRGEAGAEVEVTVEDGVRAVEMGLAAQQSARTGQTVEL